MVEQHTHIDVGISVGGRPVGQSAADIHRLDEERKKLYSSRRGSPLSKQPLGLIEHQNGVLVLGLLKDGIYVLGALPHPLAQQFPAVDDLQGLAHLIADGFGHQRLAGARLAVEQDCQSLVAALGKAPLPKQDRPACKEVLLSNLL